MIIVSVNINFVIFVLIIIASACGYLKGTFLDLYRRKKSLINKEFKRRDDDDDDLLNDVNLLTESSGSYSFNDYIHLKAV